MVLTRGSSGFWISDDPSEINPICLILREIEHLEDCPEWGRCLCAVCTAARIEKLDRQQIAQATLQSAE